MDVRVVIKVPFFVVISSPAKGRSSFDYLSLQEVAYIEGSLRWMLASASNIALSGLFERGRLKE